MQDVILKENYGAIVIGASWGGMNAIIRMLSDLPEDFPIPLIVVLHRLKNVKSSLIQLLDDKIGLKVHEVNEKEAVISGRIFVAPANYHLLIEQDYTFSLCNSAPVKFSRPSIDVLFENAAHVYGDKLIGILLTGANGDGAEGLKRIYDKKGLVIVQDPDEAEVSTMPLAAITTVPECKVLTLTEINKFLKSLTVNVQN